MDFCKYDSDAADKAFRSERVLFSSDFLLNAYFTEQERNQRLALVGHEPHVRVLPKAKMSSLQFQVGRFNSGSIWHFTLNYILATGFNTLRSASAELCCLKAVCWEHACRNYTKDCVGHFPPVEKEMQARLGKLYRKQKLRAYQKKA